MSTLYIRLFSSSKISLLNRKIMVKNMEAFLSCIVFWNLAKIENFWRELSEVLLHIKLDKFDRHKKRLNQQFKNTLTKYGNDVFYLVTNSLVGDPEVNFQDWLERVKDKDNKLAEYLELTPKNGKKYDGKCLEELLRAFRNSSTHRYGSSVFNLSTTEISALKYGQQKFSDGGVRCFLNIFPEFLLLSYRLGYLVSNHLEKFLGDSPIKHRFYSNLSNNQVAQIPNNLNDFATSLLDKIWQEINTPSELWTYSITLEGGSDIQFFKINTPATEPSLHLSQREFLTLKFELLGKKLKTIRILRSTVSNGEEIQCLLNQGDVRKLSCFESTKENSIDLRPVNSKNNFKYCADCIPICILTDVISVALAYALNFTTKQQFVIFSYQSASQIDYTMKQVLENRRISQSKVFVHDLMWNQLNNTFKNEIFTKRIPLHINSPVDFTLEEIFAKSQHFINVLRGNKLLEITQTYNLCLLSNNVPEVLCYIPRSLRSQKDYAREDHFIDKWLLGGNIKVKGNPTKKQTRKTCADGCHQIFYIISIAGMGKSTFLAKTGDELTRKNCLVKFFTAKELLYQISENISNRSGLSRLLEPIWPTSKFDHAVVKYILVNRKAPFQLLIDGFDELPNDSDRNIILDFVRDLFKMCPKPDINVIITTRTSSTVLKRDIGARKFSFDIAQFDDEDKIECISSIWEKHIKTPMVKLNLKSIISKCLKSCDELGEFGSTPFACTLIARAYETYAQDLSDLTDDNLLNASQLYEHYISDTLLKDYVKCIQKPCTPDHSLINANTVDVSSLPFVEYSDSLTRYNCFQSFRLRFPSLNQDLCASLENALHACNLRNSMYNIEHNTLIEGSLADFHAAKFIYILDKENRYASMIDDLTKFVFDNAFDLEEDQFKCDSIMRLFNSFLKQQGKQTTLFHGKAISNVHIKLYTALRQSYNCLFAAIIDNVDTDVYQGADCWNNMTGEMQHAALGILHEAIKDNKLKVIKYLLETVHVNVDFRHPITMNTALHCAILHKVNDEVINCVLDRNPQIFTIANRKGLLPIELALDTYDDTVNSLASIIGHARKLEVEYNMWQNSIELRPDLPPELVQKCRNLRAITA